MQAAPMTNPQETQLKIRLPTQLKDWIEKKAKDARRSQSAEIALRLEQSRQLDQLGALQS